MKNDDNIGDLGLASEFLRFEPYEFRLFSDENGAPKMIELQDPNQDHLDLDFVAAFELNKISGKT
jgi:hypothetical protein